MKSSTSESKPFQSRNSRLSQAGRTAGPFQIQIAFLNWFRRRTFHGLNSMYLVRLMKSSASELGLRRLGPVVHTTPEEFKNATITGRFIFLFEGISSREITWFSWSYRVRKVRFKMFSVHTKTQSRRFPPVWRGFSKSSVFVTDYSVP